MSPPNPSPLEARLERLERALATISNEVAAIRAELGAAGAGPAAPNVGPNIDATSASADATATPHSRPSPPSRDPAGGSSRHRKREGSASLDFERLLGRYGMLAIAVLAAVAAVGTFLSWAIGRGYLRLDPPARVLVGLAAAAALGAWGLKLRVRERSFGSSVLGLALVIVQVCAYAAGPHFHLVPSGVAFVGAALCSWTLAILAHGENDEPLWCVGFGGAAVAPFVTSDGGGNLYALLAYALLVLLPACFAISDRAWPVAWRVFYAASALFTVASVGLARSKDAPAFAAAFALPLIIAAAGVVPFAPTERKRAALRWLGLLTVAAAAAAPGRFTTDHWLNCGVMLAGMLLWLYLLDRNAFLPQSSLLARTKNNEPLLDWIDAAAIPLALAYTSGEAATAGMSQVPVYLVATIALAAFAWRRAVNSLRDASALATVMVASGIVALLPLEEPLGRLTAYVGLALAALVAFRLRPTLSWLASGGFILVCCAIASVAVLVDRRAFTFTPFMTESSAMALAVLIGLVSVARSWHALRLATRVAMGDRPEWTYAAKLRAFLRATTVAPWVWAFVWGTIELSMAYSASTSTLLLVTYFAATAVACVGVGRVRRSARLRQVGLLLALVAAITAFYGATTYFDFGARILAYLVTSAFLLGIAYWYRRPGGLETSDATA